MFLNSISLVNFKNYAQADFQFEEEVVCFVGKNGAGKTNILDAIHYLSMCKSYLNPVDRQNIRFGEHFFVVQGVWTNNDIESELYCGVKSGNKKLFRRNKVEYERLADHIGLYPSVMISPYDRDLISEGSEIRRKWMDGLISQFDKSYLEVLMRYLKVLEQRNALLKRFYENGFFERESMAVWDDQLVNLGTEIHQKRIAFIADFVPIFNHYYSYIGEQEEEAELEYKSQLNESSFAELLELNRRKDAQSLYTTTGTHKDDLLFSIKGNPIKKFGSQGQQKSFLIALKLAQFDCLANKLTQKPVLMLDDIFDKLDNQRVEKLIKLVSNHTFGQVFITDTDEKRVKSIFSEIAIPYQLFDIDAVSQNTEVYG